MNSSKTNDSFRQWRSKRERDPSEGRMRKKLITQAKKDQNEKENNQSFNQLESKVDLKSDVNKLDDESKQPNKFEDQINDQNAQMELSSQSSQTLKEKLASLNKSKFVIEEDEEPVNLDDELNDSEYDYDGEDLSENDENYFANEYPEEEDYNEIDFYRNYENDDEREMLEKFEKSWVHDQLDYSEEEC